MYSVEQHPEKYCEISHVSQKPAYGIKNLRKNRSVARDVWSFDKISWDVEGCYLSSFNVLQCYLESTLQVQLFFYVKAGVTESLNLLTYFVWVCYYLYNIQVGLVHEIIGNGSEAETLLQWGKSISCLQSLPLFEVAFSSALGT